MERKKGMKEKNYLFVFASILCLLVIWSGSVQCKLEIKTLTEETLEEEIAFGNWLVLYCEKGTKKCAEGEKAMEELSELHKVANLASIDCGEYEDVCLDYGVGSKNSPSFILHYEPHHKATVHAGKGVNVTEIYSKAYFRINGNLVQLFGEHFVDKYPAEISKPERKKDIKWKVRSFANNDLPFFVLFYNTWCMHSKLFMGGVWKDMGVTMKGIANIAKVDCTAEAQLCSEQGVEVTPTVKLYAEGEVYTFERERNFAVFLSEWAPENLIDFYNEHLHTSVPYPVRDAPPGHPSHTPDDLV